MSLSELTRQAWWPHFDAMLTVHEYNRPQANSLREYGAPDIMIGERRSGKDRRQFPRFSADRRHNG